MMHYVDHSLFIGDLPADELARRFGTPLYVYDLEVLQHRIETLRNAFVGLPFQPFYAMKANSNLAILALIRKAGFGADAVSPGEVFLARHAGFAGDSIWFTCSNVSDDDLLALNDPSIVINLNSMSEIDRILRLGLQNRVALRINPDIGAGHHRDVVTGGYGVKFGIDLAQIADARMILEDGEVEIVGLHSHIGSGIHSVDPLLEAAGVLIETSRSFGSLRWLNFGGGFAVPYRPSEKPFPLEQYASEFERRHGDELRSRELRVIVEPGRFIVAECGTLLARVTAKRISSGIQWIGCDTGFNHLVRPSRYGSYHHIVNASRGSADWLRESFRIDPETEGSIVAGNLCESGDVFTREGDEFAPRPLPPTREGDLLAFCDAGAYGFSMASHYNARLYPAEVIVDRGDAKLVRERQSFDDLLRGMPDTLGD